MIVVCVICYAHDDNESGASEDEDDAAGIAHTNVALVAANPKARMTDRHRWK
jgi:hypothetical protein